MIWRAEDAVRARKMNGSGETEGACEGALETHTTHLKRKNSSRSGSAFRCIPKLISRKS